MAMLRWAYTDELELSEEDAFLIDLMKLANRFQLQLLRERSAQAHCLFSWLLVAAVPWQNLLQSTTCGLMSVFPLGQV